MLWWKTVLAKFSFNKIGTLPRNSITSGHQGVPILEDIPLLNYFFTKDDNVAVNTETIVMITPYIINQNNISLLTSPGEKVERFSNASKEQAVLIRLKHLKVGGMISVHANGYSSRSTLSALCWASQEMLRPQLTPSCIPEIGLILSVAIRMMFQPDKHGENFIERNRSTRRVKLNSYGVV